MSQVFKGQSNLKLVFETGIDDLANASEVKILASRPNGSKKEFTATAVGTTLEYQLTDADIDRAGIWRFQAYVVMGGKKYFGKIVEKVFLENIKSN